MIGSLPEWLRAQLDEDERLAIQAMYFVDADWRVDVVRNVVLAPLPPSARRKPVVVTAARWRYPAIATPGLVPHVAEHDPARVLREIDAKRRTLVRCEEAMLSANPMFAHFAKQTVREMALPFADRPGYREEWRP